MEKKNTLRPYMQKAVDTFMSALNSGRKNHWIVFPKGAGASILALELAARVGKKTLILVDGDLPKAYSIARFASEYFKDTEMPIFSCLSVFDYDYDEISNARIIISTPCALSKFFESCDLVIHLNCERCLDDQTHNKAIVHYKENGSTVLGITSVLDPRIGLLFGDNSITPHFGELPTCEIGLSELASYMR